jgi:hypothetical protein
VFALATKGFAPTDADNTIVAPTNKNAFYGGNTGWQILNTSDSLTATVAVTFTVTNIEVGSPAATAGIAVGNQYRADIEIGPSGAYLFSTGNGNYVASTPLDGAPTMVQGVFFAGSAVSDIPTLLGVVNENNGANRLVYSAFGADAATANIASPLVKENFYGATTGLAVQNVGTAPAVVDLTYDCKVVGEANQIFAVNDYDIPAGAAVSFIDLDNVARWGSVLVKAGSQCAVSIVSDGAPIVALAQESKPGIDTKNYEGFNIAP